MMFSLTFANQKLAQLAKRVINAARTAELSAIPKNSQLSALAPATFENQRAYMAFGRIFEREGMRVPQHINADTLQLHKNFMKQLDIVAELKCSHCRLYATEFAGTAKPSSIGSMTAEKRTEMFQAAAKNAFNTVNYGSKLRVPPPAESVKLLSTVADLITKSDFTKGTVKLEEAFTSKFDRQQLYQLFKQSNVKVPEKITQDLKAAHENLMKYEQSVREKMLKMREDMEFIDIL